MSECMGFNLSEYLVKYVLFRPKKEYSPNYVEIKLRNTYFKRKKKEKKLREYKHLCEKQLSPRLGSGSTSLWREGSICHEWRHLVFREPITFTKSYSAP